MDDMKKRCGWCDENSALYVDYHDTEWGVPVADDRLLFEMLVLEGMQAGLSWITILKKRRNFLVAFDNFDCHSIAGYSEEKITELLINEGIIRNRLKILSVVRNAEVYLQLQKEFGSFSRYLWLWVERIPHQNNHKSLADVPAQTILSTKISKDLYKRGMRFIGPTIIYAFMQAVGLVNDHLVSCFRHEECLQLGEEFKGRRL